MSRGHADGGVTRTDEVDVSRRESPVGERSRKRLKGPPL